MITHNFNKQKRKCRSDKVQFSNNDISKIEKMAALGLSTAQIASIFEISSDTLYRRLKENNLDLSAALTRGKAKAICKVAQKAFELALAGDRSMIKYYLSTVGGWSEKSQIKEESIESNYSKAYYNHVQDALDDLSDDELEAVMKIENYNPKQRNFFGLLTSGPDLLRC